MDLIQTWSGPTERTDDMNGRSTPERMGAEAYEAGQDPDTCPYQKEHRARRRWFDGYYGRRVELLLARVLKALGLTDGK